MFNKKLIAGSIFALMSTSALAVPSFNYNQGTISQEGSAQLETVTLPVVTVTSGAEYSDDDLIVIDYNVPLDADYVPVSTLNMYAQCGEQLNGTTINGTALENGGELTLGLLSTDADAGSVTYRITDVDYAVTTDDPLANTDTTCGTSLNSSVGAVVALDATEVDGPAARAAGSVVGTYSATLPNGTTDIDGGSIELGNGVTSEVVVFVDQFTDDAGNVLIAGEIEVAAANPRSEFTYLLGAQALENAAEVTLSDDTGLASPALITALTFTLNGDFSYLEDELGADGIQNDAWSLNLSIDGNAAADYAPTTVTATSVTWVLEETAAPLPLDQIDDIEINFDNAENGNGTIAMAQGTYTYDVAIEFTDGGTDGAGAGATTGNILALTTAGAAGGFTLNGSSTIIDNYPLSTAVKHFVWVTNTGTQDGGIFAQAIGGDGAQVMTSCELGVDAPAGELISVSDELNDCLTAA
ncbi:hypothetical protein N9I05_06040, partial [Pseudomonadales bacterium]|nr:hypothetical protein [Pseudomonadales bacterium]